ncbi:Putative beta-mannosidase B [Verticillium dahliae VDG2]|nr:Putative beta-mannosidase B [Verticillium dahliae VDG2]
MPTNLPRPCSQCICRLRLRSLATRSPPLRLLSSASQHKPSKDPSATASEATASEANASEKPGNEAPAAAPQDDPPAHVGAIFRDPAWEAAERSYLTLSVETLNSLTRSYNLMAPELAKKPYYSLERELKACYADVAPLLPDMIRDRGLRPARSLLAEGQGAPRPPSMFAQLGGEGHARVYDNKAPRYGFKEMWRDIWGAKKA